ncbi:SUKH-4 family immunity protein [Streptomyces sp. Li-HN-5-11]|uniref:SUKH-4 family immunity protein n=1 Tax=Streptomyces sp. Li-HN-5-11 TaxID=3075432 RepID=UPI0028B12FBC|nr:SUKH-4 family immunity protein [Streptomyces sp. Li-HN-5-11]WNM35612.1 SUKH-4 family immunity protein [Streptomyces sp. Li-HN-5-11]
MVTFAQAQERAEEWINGDVPSYQHREVRVREFELGFVVWAEDRENGPRSDGGAQRLVIARDSGEATLWPALPVGEVIRRYEEEYGRPDEIADAVPAPAARVDLNQTSFLLSPPEWLQEAADKLGIPDRRGGARSGAGASGEGAGASGVGAGAPVSGAGVASGAASGSLPQTQPGMPGATGGPGTAGVAGAPGVPAGATPWAGTDTNADAGEDRSVPLPATVFAPPLSDPEDGSQPPGAAPDAKTALMAGGSQLPPTALAPAVGEPNASPGQGASPGPGAPHGSQPPPPPHGHPQGPGGPAVAAPPPPLPGAPSYGYPPGPNSPVAPGTPPAPPVPGAGTPPPPPGAPSYGYPHGPGAPGAPGSQPPGAPPSGHPQGPGGPAAGPGRPLAPNAGDIADAATSKAAPPPRRGRRGGSTPPPPPGAPGAPGTRPGGAPAPAGPGASGGGYVPTQLVSSLGPDGPEGAPQAPGSPGTPGAPNTPGGTPPGSVHHAATMFADPGAPGAPQPPAAPGMPGGNPNASGAPGAPGTPGAPQPPGAPGMPGVPGGPGAQGPGQGAVHHAETMLAQPPSGGPGRPGGPGTPPPPQAPGAPGAPGVPAPPGAPQPMPPGAMPPPVPGHPPVPGQAGPGRPPMPGQPVPGQPPAYGYPPQGQPMVGPGYQAVLRYRAHDGSEQQLIRRSAPGMPHPEWQIFHELRAMNVPPDQVLELHTELESCELPGAYCARMIREQWPQARLASIAPYGTDHASRQQGMQQLLAHQGELHQVADGPARPAPVRAPLPPVQPAPPVPPEAIGQELAAAFGPGVFRFEQAAVSRQGVPQIVAHTLVVAGLPADMGPFFWAQAQPGRPVPTLAELAAERGVQPAPDAASYLVMGSDFGRAICVQYGTANIVAVPVEAGPGGTSVPPQFVNTGLPEFARCLALLGRMWRLRYGLNQEQAGRWTVDFQAQLASLDPAALGSPESWWSVLLEQMWDGLL